MSDTSLAALSSIMKGVATMVGTLAAIAAAWVTLGLPIPATRDYVERQLNVFEVADQKTIEAVRQIQIDLLVSRRESVAQDIFAQEQSIKKDPENYDATRRLRMLQEQLQEINDRITDLRRTVATH